MKTFIIFDLEWNQSPYGKENKVEDCLFEIIEIGAVKLDEKWNLLGEFHRLIRPQIYTKMHYIISEVTHMDINELNVSGESFESAAASFFEWCGDEAVYCTWGSQDLTELQRNMAFYGMENPLPKPLFYYDVQKLYGLLYEDGRKLSLDTAVSSLHLPEDRPFHRALDDAYYTGLVLEQLDKNQIKPYVSIDYYRLPEKKEEHIHLVFPDYSKEVSRAFKTKEEAMMDKGILEIKCYACNRVLRKKIRWFAANQRIWYGLAVCPEHGCVKGKIRLKKAEGAQVFAVKTIKITDEEGAQGIRERKALVNEKRSQRSLAKKTKKEPEE